MRRTDLDELMSRIGERVLEQEDLLRTAWTARGNREIERRLFDRLADVCLEQLFLDLEFRHTVGEISTDDFLEEIAGLVARCHLVGLQPPTHFVDLEVGRNTELDLDVLDLDDRATPRHEPPPFEA